MLAVTAATAQTPIPLGHLQHRLAHLAITLVEEGVLEQTKRELRR